MSQSLRFTSRSLKGSLFLIVAGVIAGCTWNASDNGLTSGKPDALVRTMVGSAEIHLELAMTPVEQSRGLMHRESLAPDQGMLFAFSSPGPRSFWMRNTRIPLDIAYLDHKGMILEIYPMFPFNENHVRSRSREVWFALEVNQGWFAKNKVTTGDTLDLEPLRPLLIKHKIPVNR
jgi:uncharacterized protein